MTDDKRDGSSSVNAVELAADITVAWLANPHIRPSSAEVPTFISSIHEAIVALMAPQGSKEAATPAPAHEAAVSVRKSLASPDHIISMIDGKAYRTLRRHLGTYGLTPDEYRQRYNLKADYPMVARGYSEARRAMAKPLGLGRKPGTTTAVAATSASRNPQRRGSAAAKRGGEATTKA